MPSLRFDEVFEYRDEPQGITVPVRLNDSVDILASVDTGAAFSIFERQHGESLGMQVESGTRVMVATARGERFPVFGHEVTLTVLGLKYLATVYFAQDDSFSRNVLGRTGWLNVVRIGIVDYERKLYLGHYDSPAR